MESKKDKLPPLKPKRQVFIKILFLKVGEIDTIKEKFTADVFIQARWREETLDHRQHGHGRMSDIDLSLYWKPKLVVPNLLDSTKETLWHEVAYGKNGQAFIVEKRRLKGVFSEKLELKEFPFDAQNLDIQISSELPESQLDICEDDMEISAINVSCFVDEQEWCLIDFVESLKQVSTKEFSQNKHIRFPWLRMGFTAVRRAGYFAWNIILIMTLITSVSLATFSVEQKLPQNRLQLSIILMLTGVTFKSVANSNLPKISYYTHLDRYILFSMIFMWAVATWHAILTRFAYDSDLQVTMDFWAFIIFCVIFCGFHTIYGGYISIKYIIRRRVLQRKELAYEEKAEKLFGSSWKTDRKAAIIQKRTRSRYSSNSAMIVPETSPDLAFIMRNNGMIDANDI